MRALWILVLFACKQEAAPPAPEPPPRPELPPSPTPRKPVATPTVAASAPKQNHEEQGLELMKNERIGELFIGASEEEVVKAVGKPKQQSKPEMSEALGVYVRSWTYPGLEVWMSGDEAKGPYRVLTIKVSKGSALETSKGIGVGTPAAEVEKAYAKNLEESNEGTIVVGTMYGGLLMEIVEGKVDAIFLGAAAE
jgi:hypothetical protein